MHPTCVGMVSIKPHAERRPAGKSPPPSQTTQKSDGSKNLMKSVVSEPEAIPGAQDIGCTMRRLRQTSNPTTPKSQAGEFEVRSDSNKSAARPLASQPTPGPDESDLHCRSQWDGCRLTRNRYTVHLKSVPERSGQIRRANQHQTAIDKRKSRNTIRSPLNGLGVNGQM